MHGTVPPQPAQRLRDLLSLSSGLPFAPPPGTRTLGDCYAHWRTAFADDYACLHAIAAHDLRTLLSERLDLPLEHFRLALPLMVVLPHRHTRRFWDQLRADCDWDLPPMGLPGWAQHLFGAVFISGFVLPFFFPLAGSLVLPIAIPLSFFLERRVAHLHYPTIDKLAHRMVVQNWPAYELGKFAPDDLERVFYQLACVAFEADLPLSGWESVEISFG